MSFITATQEVISRLGNASVDSLVIKDILLEANPRHNQAKTLYSQYRGSVPVAGREILSMARINEKLPHDYRGLIVDQVVGYMFGRPVTYAVDRAEEDTDEKFSKKHRALQEFVYRNSLGELDSETGKLMSIAGYCGRLLYIDKNGDERAAVVPPWECIFIKNERTGEIELALRHYEITVRTPADGTKLRTKVVVYDNTNVTTFLEDEGGNFSIHDKPRRHMFNGVPLIKFQNNAEEIGDFEKVSDLIDAFDRLESDAQSEVEEFRLAYLLLLGGIELDAATKQKARESGVLSLPAEGDAKFLTKDLPTEFFASQRDALREEIYRHSRTVDFASEDFSGGNISGESRKWKILALENRAGTKQMYFEKALRQQFALLTSVWEKKGVSIREEDIDPVFFRNLPVDVEHYSRVIEKLAPHISKQTLYELMPFIPDAEEEKARVEAEKEEVGEELEE